MSVAYDEDDQRAGCPSIKEFVAWGSAKLYWSEGHLHAALQVGSQETLSGKNLGGTVYSMLCLKGVVVNVLLIVCTGGGGCKCSQKPEESIRGSGAGVTGRWMGCKLTSMGAWRQTDPLCEQCTPLTTKPPQRPQHTTCERRTRKPKAVTHGYFEGRVRAAASETSL